MGGDPPAPSVGQSVGEMMREFTGAFPDFLKVTSAGMVPAAQAQLAANQATAPGLAKLQAELYQAFGPQMGAISNQIDAANRMAGTQSDLAVLQGPGKQLVQDATALQKTVDPEYYATRTGVADNLSKLFSSIDLNGRLSGGENEALSRGIAQENERRGLSTTPSQTAALSNAMTFGGAQHAREQEAKNNLTQALQVANGALPALKSGTDVFQVATGRPSVNAGDSKFTGVDTSLGSSANGLGSNLLGQIGGLTQQKNDINANRRDSLDRFNQTFSSVVGSL